MAENPRPPVAIRIVRPYETEDQLLENELETIGKTSVILIGAHPRPTGVILRFEVTLASGATVLRGEGRVLAHKENAFRGLAGLSLRFTRLDPRSKAVVDRATALREARGPGSGAPPAMAAPSRPPPRPDAALAEALTAKTPPPAKAQAQAQPPAPKQETAPKSRPTGRPTRQAPRIEMPEGLTPPPAPVQLVTTPAPAPVPIALVEDAPTHVDTSASAIDARTLAPAAPPTIGAPPPEARASGSTRTVDAPRNRAELLARLRDRASKLPPERIAEIRAARR